MIPAPALRLYPWQEEALSAWEAAGRRGVVEAVTGTGKTTLGIEAVLRAIADGGQALVLVPTCELLHQWRRAMAERLPASLLIGLRGDGGTADLDAHDVVISVINSARSALRPRRPMSLLVADECHRYASPDNRDALHPDFRRRLGLTATLERPDGGHISWLAPYFGRTCFRIGFARATREGVVARFSVGLAPVRFIAEERDEYEDCSRQMATALGRLAPHLPTGSGDGLLREIVVLAKGEGPLAPIARKFLDAMQRRRALMERASAKIGALASLAALIRAAQRTLIFTHSIEGAEAAAAVANHLGVPAAPFHSGTAAPERRLAMARFASGATKVLAAPQVLDEGIDVPAADLAIVLASSRSRRQMIQRMGRVLRRKPDGRLAILVIVYLENTVEDPSLGVHAGFLDEALPIAAHWTQFEYPVDTREVTAFAERAAALGAGHRVG